MMFEPIFDVADELWTVPQAIICGLELAVLAVLIFIGLVSK